MTWSPIVLGRAWESTKLVRGWPLRSVAVLLDRTGLVVVSPTRGLDVAHGDGRHAAVEAIVGHAGPVRYLLAPNHYHHLGIPEWLAACPGAMAVATPAARKRLAKKHDDVAWGEIDELAGGLAPDTRLLVPEGTANGEAWIEIERGDERVWIVSDAFFNVSEIPGGFVGLFVRATQTGPGLRLGQTWKYMALADRARYRDWLLARLAAAPPTTLVPSHGDIARGADLGERLAAIVRERLG